MTRVYSAKQYKGKVYAKKTGTAKIKRAAKRKKKK